MKGKTGQGRTLGKDLWAGIERSVSGVEAERGQRTDWKYRRPEPSRTWNTNLNGRGLETWSSWGLRCMQCKTNGDCRVEECALGQDLCRTTIVRMWEEGEELELVEKSCTHSEKTNRTLSYRTGLKITSLTEVVCGLDLCNQGNSGRAVTYSRSRYLECISCGSSDMSCERGRHQSLQCRSPEEQCLDVVTHWMQEGEEGRPKDDRHLRGCGYLPGCPGSNGFHSNDTFHFLKCCNTTKCNEGPILELENLPQNGRQCYSCKGNSTHGCSSEETFLIDCRGPMNQCLVATGTHERSLWGSWLPCKSTTALRPPCCEEAQATHV
ncbi:urokinase plasminogen activator surface receptor isoform X3 [Gorilla gorilla gorilla]|uniref:urokinase plasminogen activator surface receptor isoform X3 n=1 Tax=Gorilla gorilla gorilla TaxID=9595 RepID=UPI0024465144|nr:urokinase plasminogen activator surface receptor isoform X3 [Gorilla gorilla gorilla]